MSDHITEVIAEATAQHRATYVKEKPGVPHCFSCRGIWSDVHQAHAVVAALKANRITLTQLPEPGQLSDYHLGDEKVWYHGQVGEFATSPNQEGETFPVWDEEGNAWSIQALRDMAAAALAAAEAAETNASSYCLGCGGNFPHGHQCKRKAAQ